MPNYVADAKSRVPQDNKTTAILLVHEMTHMPQAELLNQILLTMIRAIHAWHTIGNVPVDDFNTILGNLRRGSWSGVLTYMKDPVYNGPPRTPSSMGSPSPAGYVVAAPSPFVADQSPFGQSPAQQMGFGLIESQRARARARTMSYNLPFAEVQNLQMNEMAPPQAGNPTASFGGASPTGYGSSSPAGFAVPEGSLRPNLNRWMCIPQSIVCPSTTAPVFQKPPSRWRSQRMHTA